MADAINPQHYQGFTGGVQPIDIAEHVGFNLGNVIKYAARAGKKDNRLQDLHKALYYLQREIQREESTPRP